VRRALIGLGIVILAGAACVLLISILASRDSGSVATSSGPGTLEANRGSEELTSDSPALPASPPALPPTSGDHHPVSISKDRTELSDDQILWALKLGNVVIAYEDIAPANLQQDPYTEQLAAAGQAVILDHRPGLGGIQALAWRHRYKATGPSDPQLEDFIDAYLGQVSG